jgi:hypothetical protein
MRYLVSVILTLVVTAGVQIALLYFALSSNNELIEINAYERGLVYETVIEELRRGRDSGLTPVLNYENAGAGPQLVIEFVASKGREVATLALSGPIGVEAKSAFGSDYDFTLRPVSCGQRRFCAALEKISKGVLLIEIVASSESNPSEILRWKQKLVL